MARYDLSQLVNKKLYARQKVNARSDASTSGRLLYTFQPKEFIGVIFSAVSRPDGTWLQVDRNLAGNTVSFFVKASAAGLDVDSLRDQGAMTVQEEARAEEEASKTTGDKIFETLEKFGVLAALAFVTLKLAKK